LTAVLRHLYRAVSVECCSAPPPEKGDIGRGYYWKVSGLVQSGNGVTPSPLRGEGWDEEWFKIALDAANLAPASP